MRGRPKVSRILSLGLLAGAVMTAEPSPIVVPLAWPANGAPVQIRYLESISSPRDLRIRRGFFARLGDVILGPSKKPRALLQPFSVEVDSEGRLLVVDRTARAVHLFDRARRKHKVLEGPRRERFRSPIGLAVDSSGRIYVTDSELGKIFVFKKKGGFAHFLGDAKGEGIFKRPTGLGIDPSSGLIYLTDTLRHMVHVLDAEGRIVREWGERGDEPGQFNFPTDVALEDGHVFVLDAMNFRVQVFATDGRYITSFGKPVNKPGGLFRPKSLAVDKQNKLVYVVDAFFDVVQAFRYDGSLQLAFGHEGSGPGEFRMPSGICLQPDGRILVADSLNGRIQVFQLREKLTAALRGSR